jgi:hypothetical protein
VASLSVKSGAADRFSEGIMVGYVDTFFMEVLCMIQFCLADRIIVLY